MGIVRAAQASLGRPVVLILEHFENFFTEPSLTVAGRERFRDALRDFRDAMFRYPTCLVISIRQQALGQLAYFQPAVPDIYHHVVALDLLLPSQARRAVLAPLEGLQPPMVFDPRFLDERLLPDLATSGREDGAIDPPHLQIVCKALYDAARTQGQQFINADLYDSLGGKQGTLGGYVDRALSEEFPDAARYELARKLLKAMASPSGQTMPLSLATAAEQTGQRTDAVLGVLEVLVRRSLIVARAEQTFGLSHPTMIETVLGWFDRLEAETRCAQDTLDHAWYDWLAWDRLGDPLPADARQAQPAQTVGTDRDQPAPLLNPARLPEVAACREHLRIEPGQHALLLRSAAGAGADAAPWIQTLTADQATRSVVADLQQSGAASGRERPVRQFARVLGVTQSVEGQNILGQAAIGERSGEVRQAATLALASLGSDAVAQAFWPPGGGQRPLSESWRTAQALAWMRASGCRLPELPSLWLRVAVSVGERLARFRADWGGIAAEMLGAALGVAAAYVLGVAMQWSLNPLPTAHPYLLALAYGLSSASLGFILGGLTVLVARFLAPDPWTGQTARPAWQVVAGITVGFVVGLVVAYPAELAFAGNLLPEAKSVLGRYLLGGALMGLGIAVGFIFGDRKGSRVAIAAAMVGAMCAGLTIGALNRIAPWVGLPNLTTVGGLQQTLLQYALYGALVGAGLVGGWLAARHIRSRWQMRQVGALFSRSVIEK